MLSVTGNSPRPTLGPLHSFLCSDRQQNPGKGKGEGTLAGLLWPMRVVIPRNEDRYGTLHMAARTRGCVCLTSHAPGSHRGLAFQEQKTARQVPYRRKSRKTRVTCRQEKGNAGSSKGCGCSFGSGLSLISQGYSGAGIIASKICTFEMGELEGSPFEVCEPQTGPTLKPHPSPKGHRSTNHSQTTMPSLLPGWTLQGTNAGQQSWSFLRQRET